MARISSESSIKASRNKILALSEAENHQDQERSTCRARVSAPGMNHFLAIAAVALGGAVGSDFRYTAGAWFLEKFGSAFPWGTLVINVSGAFLIGIVLQIAAMRAGFNPYWRLFFATGVLGGYTTFSTFAYEIVQLSNRSLQVQSVVYALASILGGVVAVVLGSWVARVCAAA
jgi:CrcB protein